MVSETTWRTLREHCETLDPGEVLVTPDSERVLAIERTDGEGITVRYRDDGERTLDRDQFDALLDRLASEPLSLDALPPGVEPYVTVLSLLPSVAVDQSAGELRLDEEAADSESPFVRSLWDVRRPPEEVHDDALLVADFLERHDALDREGLSPAEMVDLYVLLSDVQWGADDLRRDVGDDLLDHVGPEGRLHGQYGTVSRTRRERRSLQDEDVVLERLDEAGVPRDWVLGVDEEKLDVVVATTDVEEADVYDVHEQYYLQKTGVEEEAKRTRLQGLRDRLAELEGEEGEELREEIETLEERIDDVLAAG